MSLMRTEMLAGNAETLAVLDKLELAVLTATRARDRSSGSDRERAIKEVKRSRKALEAWLIEHHWLAIVAIREHLGHS
jgi:DNA-directed RNA polymerase subunit K/omega